VARRGCNTIRGIIGGLLRRSTVTVFAVVLLAALGSAAVARGRSHEAAATSASGCYLTYQPNESCAIGDLVVLIGSQAYDDAGTHRVCAAAETSSGSQYASYECGTGYAEHCYSAGYELYALIGSGSTSDYNGYGTATWNAACP
jgi:hypothetical protein